MYDLKVDSLEAKNLIRSEEHQVIIKQMNKQLFEMLRSTGGMYIPLYEDRGIQQNLRYEYGSPGASFPSHMKREKTLAPGEKQPAQSAQDGKKQKK